MLDKDNSGGLGFEEFKSLWIDLRNWRVSINDNYQDEKERKQFFFSSHKQGLWPIATIKIATTDMVVGTIFLPTITTGSGWE